LSAVVSILPQAYFVERVGGPYVDVEALVQPGQSPHTYEPTPRQVARLGEAKVYFTIGIPFEQALLRKIDPGLANLRVVDTRRGVKLRAMADADVGSGPQADHDEDEYAGAADPHIWLDPHRTKIMARTICETLSRLDSAHAAAYGQNLSAFEADLDRVDAKIARILSPFKGREFFVFHPAFGYFAEAYGLKQVAIETAGKEPGGKQLAALMDRAQREHVRVIFVQAQFSRSSAEAVAHAIGGVVAPIDDLAHDYLANLEFMASALADGLRREQ